MTKQEEPEGSKERKVYMKPALKCLELFPQKIVMVQLSARTENYSNDPKHPGNSEGYNEINYDGGWNSKKYDSSTDEFNW
jgi:hypothetical protein